MPDPPGYAPAQEWYGKKAIVQWQNSCFKDLTGLWRPYTDLLPGKYAIKVCSHTVGLQVDCRTGAECIATQQGISLRFLLLKLPSCMSANSYQVTLANDLQVATQRLILLASACNASENTSGRWWHAYIQLLLGVHGENICTEAGRKIADVTLQKLLRQSAACPVQVHIRRNADGQDVVDMAIVDSNVVQTVIIAANPLSCL